MAKRKRGKRTKLSAKQKHAMQEGRKKKAATKKQNTRRCQVCKTVMTQNNVEAREGWYWCPKCGRYTEPPMGEPTKK